MSTSAELHYRALLTALPVEEVGNPAIQRLAWAAATLIAQIEQGEARIEEEGMVIESSNGGVKAHPLLSIVHTAHGRLTTHLRAMRVLPSGDKRLMEQQSKRQRAAGVEALPPAPDEDQPDWSELARRKQ